MPNILFQPIERMSKLLARATEIAAITMTCVMLVALLLQIISRYFFGATIVWTEELALLMFTWVIFLGGTLGVRKRFHARLRFLLDYGPAWSRLLLERFTDLVIAVFSVFLIIAGIDYLRETTGSFSAAVEYPLEWLYVVAPVTGALMLVHAIAALLAPIQLEPSTDA
jgi:TRAP-type C4-dicarboxylate transport system permease small subunit